VVSPPRAGPGPNTAGVPSSSVPTWVQALLATSFSPTHLMSLSQNP
jgi:hypothetical protein